jgi:hypothetical protein
VSAGENGIFSAGSKHPKAPSIPPDFSLNVTHRSGSMKGLFKRHSVWWIRFTPFSEDAIVKRTWKAHIKFENYMSQERVAMDAPRRQSVALN